jgi:hypothetical protein
MLFIRWVMRAVLETPKITAEGIAQRCGSLKVAHTVMTWMWHKAITTASKVPWDWIDQGVCFA